MQWRKLSNINPPPNQILILHWVDMFGHEHVEFCHRFTNEEGEDSMETSTEFNALIEDEFGVYECPFEQFKEDFKDAYWCIYHRPNEE